MAGASLAVPIKAYISIEPWLTATELMKLASYALVFILARVFCTRTERADFLLTSLIMIGAVYCAYALLVAALGRTQFEILYNLPAMDRGVAAPFINHNNFATYAGMIGLCAGVKFFERGDASVVSTAGPRVYLSTLVQYSFGRGLSWLVPALLAISALIATASRAGNAGFLTGLLTACLLAVAVNADRLGKARMALLSAVLLISLVLLVSINGASLMMRFDDMGRAGLELDARQQMWTTAMHMIAAAPFLGLGLGTYPAAYPLYTDATLPFIIDHAHNDYLELAAGWGLPAAFLWWSALLLVIWTCARGVFQRKRNRIYPILAVAVAVQVGFHSFFDFSLQIPAIALIFAAILGMGVAQAFPTRSAEL
jgi:O-antigen ligase